MDKMLKPDDAMEPTINPQDGTQRSRHSTSSRHLGSKDEMRWLMILGWILLGMTLLLAVGLSFGEAPGHRARIKDVATIEGIRDNQLVGYGLVVGLRGTGDSSQTIFPAQTLISALERMGVTVPQTAIGSPPLRKT
jgi:hypothetical protein